jgi:hypothetical protein
VGEWRTKRCTNCVPRKGNRPSWFVTHCGELIKLVVEGHDRRSRDVCAFFRSPAWCAYVACPADLQFWNEWLEHRNWPREWHCALNIGRNVSPKLVSPSVAPRKLSVICSGARRMVRLNAPLGSLRFFCARELNRGAPRTHRPGALETVCSGGTPFHSFARNSERPAAAGRFGAILCSADIAPLSTSTPSALVMDSNLPCDPMRRTMQPSGWVQHGHKAGSSQDLITATCLSPLCTR